MAGVLAGAAESAEARPADRYAAWLRAQAHGEFRALVDVALRQTILPPAPTPGEFLAGYAAAQARVAPAPTGALFGYSDLTLLQALGRLEGRMSGLSAPPSPVAVTAALVAAPALPLGGAALPGARASRTRTVAWASARRAARGAPAVAAPALRPERGPADGPVGLRRFLPFANARCVPAPRARRGAFPV